MIPNLDANVLVVVNGFFDETLSTIPNQNGLTIASLNKAKQEGLEGLKKHFNQYSKDKAEIFLALNNGYHTDGIYVEVDKNVVVEKTIHIINIIS